MSFFQSKPISKPQELLILLLGLVLFFLQALDCLRVNSATSDEISHLPSGYSYLETSDFRLNPQHPPFAKLWAALPLLQLNPAVDWNSEAWKNADEWTFGYDFLFHNDANTLLFRARLQIVVLGLLLGVVVWCWARDWYGPRAASLAIFLYALCPPCIAHSCFVTTDIAVSLFWSSTLWFLWKYLAGEDRHWKYLCGLSLGAALASKYSALLLLPAIPLLLISAHWNKPGCWAKIFWDNLCIFALAFFVLQVCYGLPADPLIYLHGLSKVNADHIAEYPKYLFGEFSSKGFLSYFVLAFSIKTPLPLLLLFVAWLFSQRSLRGIGEAKAASALKFCFAVIPAVLLWVGVTFGADNIGVRYVLPFYPLIIVLASSMVTWFDATKFRRLLHGVLCTWYAVGCWQMGPHKLAYFNELVGGPSKGHFYLDDSNIEWGEGLKELKSYCTKNNITKIKVLYPWPSSPFYYHIPLEEMKKSDWYESPTPGIYAISAHALIRGLYDAKARGVHTDWLKRYTPIDRIGYSFFIYKFD